MSTIITHRQFPNYHKYEMELAGRPLTLEVGKLPSSPTLPSWSATATPACSSAPRRPPARGTASTSFPPDRRL